MRTAFVYDIVKRWVFLGATVIMVFMNFLSNAIPFGGQTNAEVSALYPTLITPAGYAFSIWGVIYVTLLVLAVFQLQRAREIRFYKLVWPYFIISCIANSLWLVAFQNEWLGLSVAIILVLLWSLFSIFKLFYRLRRLLNTTHKFFFHIPMGLYFGWVSIATMVNVAVFVRSLNLSFLTGLDEVCAIALLTLGFALTMYVLLAHRDYFFALSVIWAYVAIWIANTDCDSVMNTAKIAAIVLTATLLFQFVSGRLKVAFYGKQVS